MSADPFNLQRFTDAQTPVIAAVLAELRLGRKASHWMWFIFPQVAGLGFSAMSQKYAIGSGEEANAYLAHPVLGDRLRECVELVVEVEGRFGGRNLRRTRRHEVPFLSYAFRGNLRRRGFPSCSRQVFRRFARSGHAGYSLAATLTAWSSLPADVRRNAGWPTGGERQFRAANPATSGTAGDKKHNIPRKNSSAAQGMTGGYRPSY